MTSMNGDVTDEDWWRTAVVYQVYPRSFADSDGDGIGDLRGLISRLDHLERLGVDVVWLSPIYPSPQDDAGYDISDYQDVDPTFGTLADLDELLESLHARGMRLMMDLVVNHTSDEHPWFVESKSSPDNPKRDWYWWRPPRAGMAAGAPGAEPTNWESFFSGPAWTLDEASGDYYLHLFARKQPDLNWENPEVREAVYSMMRWWLDRGVDGFRMDVINLISKDTSLPDGIVHAGALGDGTPHVMNGPRIHEFLAELHREVLQGRDRKVLTVGEMPGATIEDALLYTDPERREVDMVFTFEHMDVDHAQTKWDLTPFRLPALKAVLGRWQAGLADVGWNSLYWNNHDQPRVVSRFGDDGAWRVRSATLLGTVLHLHRGTPYVYQGEELGMTNHPFGSIDEFRGHRVAQPLRPGRQSRRRPRAGARVAALPRPRQRAYADAVGRLAARGVHHRGPVVARQPEPHGDQRRGGDRRRGLGLPPLPTTDRAPAHRAGGGARRLHHARAGRRDRVRVHPFARRRRAAGRGQLLRRAGARRPRPHRVGRRRAAAGQRAVAVGRSDSASWDGSLEPWEARVLRRRR